MKIVIPEMMVRPRGLDGSGMESFRRMEMLYSPGTLRTKDRL